MELTVQGYLNSEHNIELFIKKTPLDDVKTLYIKLLDSEFKKKIKNVILNHKIDINTVKVPILLALEGGLILKIKTQKFTKYLGDKMKLIDRNEWCNQKYIIKFMMKKYTFIDKINNKKINGFNFILKSIDLVI